MNIEKLAIRIGKRSRKVLNIDEDQEEVVVYGAIIALNTSMAICSVMIVGLLFGVFYESLLFSTVASILRKYSGGVHSSSSGRCVIIGTITAVVTGLAIDSFLYDINITAVVILSIINFVASFIIIYRRAPVDSIKKPIIDIEIRKKFKKISIVIILVTLIIILILFILYINYLEIYYIKAIECISLGIIYQSITLTKIGIGSHNKVDFVLKYIMEGEGKNER